jgi:hypothetical protein
MTQANAIALPKKERIVSALKRRFFLRVHMFVILGGTLTVGLLATKALFLLHQNLMALRYGLAVGAGYLAFLGFVKLWLAYVAWCVARERHRSADDWFDCIDFGSGGIDLSSSPAESLSGGGGRFGGGGATGSWGEANTTVAAPVKSSGGSSGSKFGGFDVDDDLVLILLVVLLVIVIVVAACYVIYAAPVILSEAAFNAALAAALARKTHKISNGSWVGGVVRATAFPFIAVLAVAVTLGYFAQKRCPTATRLREAIHCVRM